jgi:hypothetical protein
MPQIIISTEGPGGNGSNEVHRERITPADFESETASLLLIQRIGWALSDADELEHRTNWPDDPDEAAPEPLH